MSHFFSAASVDIPKDFPLKIVKESQDPYVPMHSHEFSEIAFVAGGYARHTHISRDGRICREGLIQGDLFSVLPGESHSYEHCKSMVLYNIFFDPGIFDHFPVAGDMPTWRSLLYEHDDTAIKKRHLSGGQLSRAIQCLDRAIREAHLRQEGYKTVMTALFLEFLIPAMRLPGQEVLLGEESYGILESISLMEEQPERKFTLKQLARLSSMSIPSYTKKFRIATGLSPMNYLQKVRLLKVCDALTMSDAALQTIAEQCGFCSSNYLIKIFHREIGVTPEQFRRRQINQK